MRSQHGYTSGTMDEESILPWDRREFIAGVGSAAAGVATAAMPHAGLAAGGEAPAEKPNILLIISDQHSKHFLGSAGNGIVRTPHLDRLAAEGMRFANAYCPAPLCVPSRMSFLTGRTPSQNRVWNNNALLCSGESTWAHTLSSAGYETSLIGRMHFRGSDQLHGFENRPIGEYGATHPGAPFNTTGPNGRIYYHGGSGQSRSAVTKAGRGTTTYQYQDEQVTEQTIKFLREKAKQSDQPFAAVTGFVLPHCPFIAPKELFDHYFERTDVPEVQSSQPPTITRFRKLRGILKPPLTPHQIRVARAAYYGLCEHMDRLIGKILQTLDETGLARNTLVIYCSDHGEMAGDHGCWWKSNYYEGSVGVPLIARLPGAIPAGRVSADICNLIDLGATFAETAGTNLTNTAGRSLWPLLRGDQGVHWEQETYSEFCDIRGGYLPSRMIRSGKWKLWTYADSDKLPPALFNLEDDPGELRDLGSDAGHARIRNELTEKLMADWKPRFVQSESRRIATEYARLTKWGKATKPPAPYALKIPPPSHEADVEYL